MTTPLPQGRPAHLGWRVLALVYDLFPALALVLLFGAGVTAVAWALGHPDLSDLPWAGPLLALGAWGFAGAYFVLSWARGGQTLGMRPWRLRVVAVDGARPGVRELALRYAWATAPSFVALELAALVVWPEPNLPFWIALAALVAGWAWALADRERVPLHDRLSGTRLVRLVTAA